MSNYYVAGHKVEVLDTTEIVLPGVKANSHSSQLKYRTVMEDNEENVTSSIAFRLNSYIYMYLLTHS